MDKLAKEYTLRDVEVAKELNAVLNEIEKLAESLKKDNTDYAKAMIMGVAGAQRIVQQHLSNLGSVKEE